MLKELALASCLIFNTVTAPISMPQQASISIKPNEIAQIEAGDHNSWIVTKSGDLYATGSNFLGIMGLGHADTVYSWTKLPITNVKKVSVADDHAVVLTKDGKLYGSGADNRGEWGIGKIGIPGDQFNVDVWTELPGITEPIIDVETGSEHTMAIGESGNYWFTGSGRYYKSGLKNGEMVNRDGFIRSDRYNQAVKSVSQIALNKSHFNGWGQSTILGSVGGKDGLYSVGEVFGGNPYVYWTDINKVGKTITHIEADAECSMLAIGSDKKLYGGGKNHTGQLGVEGSQSSMVYLGLDDVVYADLSIGAKKVFYSVALKSNGDVYVAGECAKGGTGLGTAPTNGWVKTSLTGIDKIEAGAQHTFALDVDKGRAYFAGCNCSGERGFSGSGSNFEEVPLFDSEPPVISLIAKNPKEWTNGSVTITVTATDNTGLHNAPYSFDNGSTWQSQNSKTFTNNSLINIKVKDTYNNTVIRGDSITNIDKLNPNVPSFTVD